MHAYNAKQNTKSDLRWESNYLKSKNGNKRKTETAHLSPGRQSESATNLLQVVWLSDQKVLKC